MCRQNGVDPDWMATLFSNEDIDLEISYVRSTLNTSNTHLGVNFSPYQRAMSSALSYYLVAYRSSLIRVHSVCNHDKNSLISAFEYLQQQQTIYSSML